MDVYKHWCKQWIGMRGETFPLTNSGIYMVPSHQCSHLAAMIGTSLFSRHIYSIILFCRFVVSSFCSFYTTNTNTSKGRRMKEWLHEWMNATEGRPLSLYTGIGHAPSIITFPLVTCWMGSFHIRYFPFIIH
jgi:hypothetical protein